MYLEVSVGNSYLYLTDDLHFTEDLTKAYKFSSIGQIHEFLSTLNKSTLLSMYARSPSIMYDMHITDDDGHTIAILNNVFAEARAEYHSNINFLITFTVEDTVFYVSKNRLTFNIDKATQFTTAKLAIAYLNANKRELIDKLTSTFILRKDFLIKVTEVTDSQLRDDVTFTFFNAGELETINEAPICI